MCAGRYGRPQWARWRRRGDEREKTVKKTRNNRKTKKQQNKTKNIKKQNKTKTNKQKQK
jgi:hypothetical protein